MHQLSNSTYSVVRTFTDHANINNIMVITAWYQWCLTSRPYGEAGFCVSSFSTQHQLARDIYNFCGFSLTCWDRYRPHFVLSANFCLHVILFCGLFVELSAVILMIFRYQQSHCIIHIVSITSYRSHRVNHIVSITSCQSHRINHIVSITSYQSHHSCVLQYLCNAVLSSYVSV